MKVGSENARDALEAKLNDKVVGIAEKACVVVKVVHAQAIEAVGTLLPAEEEDCPFRSRIRISREGKRENLVIDRRRGGAQATADL